MIESAHARGRACESETEIEKDDARRGAHAPDGAPWFGSSRDRERPSEAPPGGITITRTRADLAGDVGCESHGGIVSEDRAIAGVIEHWRDLLAPQLAWMHPPAPLMTATRVAIVRARLSSASSEGFTAEQLRTAITEARRDSDYYNSPHRKELEFVLRSSRSVSNLLDRAAAAARRGGATGRSRPGSTPGGTPPSERPSTGISFSDRTAVDCEQPFTPEVLAAELARADVALRSGQLPKVTT